MNKNTTIYHSKCRQKLDISERQLEDMWDSFNLRQKARIKAGLPIQAEAQPTCPHCHSIIEMSSVVHALPILSCVSNMIVKNNTVGYMIVNAIRDM